MKKKLIQKIFSLLFKKKHISVITSLAIKPFFRKEGYWVLKQLLNRGYLNDANSLMHKLTYKKHFEYIIRRINFMMIIKSHGFSVNKLKKGPIKDPNVLFCVHNSLPYDFAGYAIRTKNISQELIKRNIQVTVSTRPGYPLDLLKHRKLYQTIPNEDSIHNVKYIRLKDNNKKFKKGADIEYIDIYANALVEYSKRYHINILHAHSNYLNGHAAIKASNILKIPVIYEIRGLWYKTRTLMDENYQKSGMYTYEENMEKSAALSADSVVTISTALKELIISWGIDKNIIHIVPNMVDINKFIPLFPDNDIINQYRLKDKTVIGFIGSLTSYEGLSELIVAIDELIEQGLNISLLIVGDGREKEKLQKLAKSEYIIFTGHVPLDSIVKYYSVIDICPFPRNNVEICRYVPPLKILEAMAMKKAIIVSNLAPLREIIQHNFSGLICETDDIKSLKQNILILYKNKNLKNSLASNARKWVLDNRSGEQIAKQYIKIYAYFK